MLAHQLDLFGGAPKPPKKIKVDDDIPAEEFSPAPDLKTAEDTEPAAIISEPTEEIPVESIAGMEATEPLSHFLDEAVVSNNVEWSPEEDEEVSYRENEVFHAEKMASGHIEEDVQEQAHNAGYDEEESGFGNEPVFGETETTSLAETKTKSTTEEAEITGVVENEKVITKTDATPAATAKSKRDDRDDGLNIPADEELFKRQYYSMRETSAMFGVNQSLLRFWENEFDILEPKKNKKGDRYFRPVDVKNLVLIYNLLRIRKFTLEGAKEYLNRNKKAADTFELAGKLEKIKSFLLELKAGL